MAIDKRKQPKRSSWNKGVEVGPRDLFTPSNVRRIWALLAKRGDAGMRDLALFSTAIDTMLHASDLLSLTVNLPAALVGPDPRSALCAKGGPHPSA